MLRRLKTGDIGSGPAIIIMDCQSASDGTGSTVGFMPESEKTMSMQSGAMTSIIRNMFFAYG